MSSFLVCDEILSVIARAMTRPDYHNRELGKHVGCAPELPPSSAAYILRALGEFNVDRVNVRYGENAEFSGRYMGNLPEVNDFQVIKFCECYLYQCAEGEDCKTHVVFQAVEKLLDIYMTKVIHADPRYESAEWSIFPAYIEARKSADTTRPDLTALW